MVVLKTVVDMGYKRYLKNVIIRLVSQLIATH